MAKRRTPILPLIIRKNYAEVIMREIENFEIEKIGVLYTAHFNCVELRLYVRNFGVHIPFNRVGEFCALFPDVDWEDGGFLEQLNGRYMRVIIDGGIVKGFMHITKDLVYMCDKEDKDDKSGAV